MRPLLRPGTHVLTRTDGRLQLGLHPDQAVVVDPSPELRRGLLGEVADHVPGLPALAAAGLLVDERAVMPLIAPGRDGLPGSAAAAVVRQGGDRAPDLLAARSGRPVQLVTFGHPAHEQPSGAAGRLLSDAGVQVRRSRSASGGGRTAGGRTAVGLLVGVGEPDRSLGDPWLRAGTPHLVVRLVEGRALVGPFVVPGTTACLRCLDAHHSDADPEWPLLVHQFVTACGRDRADGCPEPVDPVLATVAVAWAARDIVTFLESGRPSTWSATLLLGPDLTAVEVRRWLRHADCACTWS